MAQAAVTTSDRTPVPPAPPLEVGRGVSPASVLKYLVQRREATVITVTVLAIIYFAVRTSSIFQVANISVTTQYMGPILVIGVGEVLMLVLAEIDLSAGQVYLTAPWFVYWFWHNMGVPIGLAIVISLALCAAIGLTNGLITVLLGVPSLVVTLGMQFLLYGVVLVVSSYTQEQLPVLGTTYATIFGAGAWADLGWGVAIAAGIWFLLKRTRFGVHVTATGGNTLAAAEAGIPVKRVKVWCFMIVSVVSGYIGILDLIRQVSMDPGSYGLNIVLAPIVAAVIGGTALTGGRATVLGTFIGALFLSIVDDGLNLTGVSANWFYLLEGIIILVLMIINVRLGRFALRFRR
ncbi:MAG TPA: ABC transporter permease [Acidimicrobiales bacterium]|nr:ABC transporter permease [Acidimicrobiales bacterium]